MEVGKAELSENVITMQLLPEDVMGKHDLSFLTLRDVVRLDSSLTHRKLRQFLHASSHRSVLNGAIDFRHLNWCKFRECSTKTLRVTGALDKDVLCHDTYRHEVLQVCTTVHVSEHALRRLLKAGDDFKVLNIQTFYCIEITFCPLKATCPCWRSTQMVTRTCKKIY